MDQWKNRYKRIKISPDDSKVYLIQPKVIELTHKVLSDYRNFSPSAEGVVYWAGTKSGDKNEVFACIAPKADATRYNFRVSHSANADVAEFLADNDLIYIAQVHSHPGYDVNHSIVDDLETGFKSEGLVSIVVPLFCRDGMIPFETCGIHRFSSGEFYRLSENYIEQHFNISEIVVDTIFKDFRL